MVDRTWWKYRISSENLPREGGPPRPSEPRPPEVMLEKNIPVSREDWIDLLESMGLNSEGKYNCASVRFSYEESQKYSHLQIACYRVDWHWKPFPDYYGNHTDELYYVFLNLDLITLDNIVEDLGMDAYTGRATAVIPQIVSKFHLHRNQDSGSATTFKRTPDPIMGAVTLAMGFSEGYQITTTTSQSAKPPPENTVEGETDEWGNEWIIHHGDIFTREKSNDNSNDWTIWREFPD